MDKNRLARIIDHLPKGKILVIGDAMMDVFVWGRVNRISPEAPVPVVDVVRESWCLGGAANVANNLFLLDTKVFLSGVIGNDEMGQMLKKEIKKMGINNEGLIIERDRPTTVKTRIIAHGQQVVRVDREKRQPINNDTIKKILEFVETHIFDINAILISDYAKGLICPALMTGLKNLIKGKDILLSVDPKVKNMPLFKGVNILTPNHYEAIQAIGFNGIVDITEDIIKEAGQKLLKTLNTKAILITKGEAGMTLFEGGGKITHVPAVAREVYDVTGAGDTVIATFTAASVSGATLEQAAILANLAAGIVVEEIGIAPVSRGKLLEALKMLG